MSVITKFVGLKSLLSFDNKWELLFNRLIFRRGLNIYMYRGMEILIDHAGGDANGTRLCLTSDMYKRYLSMMKLSSPVTILDLGANGGGFPLLLNAEGIPLRKLVCIEMNPNTWQRLEFNIQHNLACARYCANIAVGGYHTELELFLGKGSTSDSIYDSRGSETDGLTMYNIPCWTFDEIYRHYFDGQTIDVCKIDVEGAEYDIFLNAEHESVRRCRYLILEIHNNSADAKHLLIDMLYQSGFEQFSNDNDYGDVYLFGNRSV